MTIEGEAKAAAVLGKKIRALLAGKPPGVQGAALADALAMLLEALAGEETKP